MERTAAAEASEKTFRIQNTLFGPPPEDDGLSYNLTIAQFRYRQNKWCETDGCKNVSETSQSVRFS